MPLYYEADIRRALSNAPRLDMDEYAANRAERSPVADLPDEALLALDDAPAEPNEIVVGAAFELRRVYDELLEITNTPAIGDLDYDIVHEIQHASAAEALGGYVIGFTLRIWQPERYLPYQLRARISEMRVPKIGWAAITAYPDRPSEDDMWGLVNMGYEGGIPEVGARIEAYNHTYAQSVPLPRSYYPQG